MQSDGEMKMNHRNIAIFVALTTLILFVLLMVLSGNSMDKEKSKLSDQNNMQQGDNQTAQDVAELKVEILSEGSGEVTEAGDLISVHYTGTLLDGTKFDSSVDGGTPFEFTLGQGSVIQGWDQGLQGIKVGSKVKLTIPSSMGYGNEGRPPKIPGKAALVFEVEILEIKS